MGQVKTATLARHNAPPFGIVAGAEALKLRQLPLWMRWLFLELRMMSDFRTGQLETSYAVLRALCDCDSGERGGPSPFVPSLQQIRRAVDQLAALELVERHPLASEGGKRLFLTVQPARGISASAPKLGRRSDRPPRVKKPSKHAASSPMTAPVSADVPAGDSAPAFTTPKAPAPADLSTERKDEITRMLRSTSDRLKRAAAGKK